MKKMWRFFLHNIQFGFPMIWSARMAWRLRGNPSAELVAAYHAYRIAMADFEKAFSDV
jgi:hypothetical protein